MKIRLYQINGKKDEKKVRFLGYGMLEEFQGSPEVNAGIYDRVYDGDAEANTLEDLYELFNVTRPEGFKGSSMSVSDVIEIVESDSVAPGFYFCDNIGFKEISFDAEKTDERIGHKIKVLMVEPGKRAYEKEIGNNLDDIYSALNCRCFQAVYPFNDYVAIICDDDGKINGSEPNRPVYDDGGNFYDVIFGNFFVCDCSGSEFDSLPDDMMKKYKEMFLLPYKFIRTEDGLIAVQYDPEK